MINTTCAFLVSTIQSSRNFNDESVAFISFV
jgi:hypothetical protein